MKIQIIFMVAMETKIIIVTMTAKQPHFASSEQFQKSNRKNTERGNINIPNIHRHNRSLS
jgi:hypothetical protein